MYVHICIIFSPSICKCCLVCPTTPCTIISASAPHLGIFPTPGKRLLPDTKLCWERI